MTTCVARCLTTLLVLIGLGACTTYQTYPGPKRAASEVAVLEIGSASSVVLDDVAMPGSGVTRVSLLPGRHEVEWEFVHSNAYVASQRLEFKAEAGARYRLGQRFFPAPHPHGFVGAVVDLAIDTGLAPLTLLFPPEPAETPADGEYYCWIIDLRTDQIRAGTPPDLPPAHAPIALVPIDDGDPAWTAAEDEDRPR